MNLGKFDISSPGAETVVFSEARRASVQLAASITEVDGVFVSFSLDLYRIWANEASLELLDLVPRAASASFVLRNPSNNVSAIGP